MSVHSKVSMFLVFINRVLSVINWRQICWRETCCCGHYNPRWGSPSLQLPERVGRWGRTTTVPRRRVARSAGDWRCLERKTEVTPSRGRRIIELQQRQCQQRQLTKWTWSVWPRRGPWRRGWWTPNNWHARQQLWHRRERLLEDQRCRWDDRDVL